ncbi:sensor histidine kinase [Cohnella thailandensis]|uniref:histidine kinase n=1 Tax=Cohnella thailandensis TaxID=557557 RepID=A0A841SV02_9BACL|nr:sensor histidine kinase [Cohnella thailandensis]MBB6636143.1 histidine kinase [Cohnella thailandensis]MBP1973888.1 two-component system sensor histidine kinase YesM [Cohnella thailandensis]
MMPRMKIRTKIIASTLLVVSVSLLLSGFLTYDYATDIIRDQSIKDSKTKLAQISSQLKRLQDQVVKTAEYIVSDEEIRELVYDPPSNSYEENYFRKNTVQEKLKRFTALNDFILNALIVRPDGETFSNNSGYEDYFAEYLKQPWFEKQKQMRSGFSDPHPFFFLSGNRQTVSYVLKYRPIGMNETSDSYLILDFAYSEIDEAFAQSSGDFAGIELLSGSGGVLYRSPSEASTEQNGFMRRAIENGDYYLEDKSRIVLVNDSMSQGWIQAAMLSKSALFAKINNIFYYYIAMIGIGFLISLLIMLPIVLNLTKPLSRLTHAMKRVSVGDLQTSVAIRSKDELEILGNGFNRMVADLKRNMETSLRDEETKRRMQIDLLMAQINPHFIYNTLNTVIYLTHAERNRQAVEMTQALIAILQDTVKTGEGTVFATLEEERRIVDRYAAIQQTRYPGKFDLKWEIESALTDAILPRMILQPLVENAILHGLFPVEREEEGLIVIRAYLEQPHVLILEVEDNGAGIPAAEDERNDSPTDTAQSAAGERTRGIGLKNIRERIRYHYGEPYGIHIGNAEGQGTIVAVRLPYRHN